LAVAHAAPPLGGEVLIESAAICQSRERIRHGHGLDNLVGLLKLLLGLLAL